MCASWVSPPEQSTDLYAEIRMFLDNSLHFLMFLWVDKTYQEILLIVLASYTQLHVVIVDKNLTLTKNMTKRTVSPHVWLSALSPYTPFLAFSLPPLFLSLPPSFSDVLQWVQWSKWVIRYLWSYRDKSGPVIHKHNDQWQSSTPI